MSLVILQFRVVYCSPVDLPKYLELWKKVFLTDVIHCCAYKCTAVKYLIHLNF